MAPFTFFFDNLDKAPASDGPHAEPLVRAMSGALVALARNGDPNHDALRAWPAYTIAGRAEDEELEVVRARRWGAQ